VREINEDAFVERPEIGLWAVADGLGGHRDGEIASRMVCDALADFMPQSSLEDTVEAVRERLQAVNRHLFRSAMLPGSYSGSTVVVLLARGSRCAALWAGDSRLYRCRDGRLEQLSRDHSAVSSTSLGNPEERNVVTRAVGVASRLLLDAHRDEVRAGDRFLLCSDGLTRTVPDVLVQSWMEQDVEVAVRGLVESALNAGAPDNVTVLVAEACAEEA
jgi:serine/threonine protein phosphatase PrpC